LALVLLNRGGETAYVTVDMRRDLTVPWDVYRMRDLWKHQDLGPYDIAYTAEVRAHEAKVYRVWKVECRVGC
jgi:alpha-galactosidase